MTSLIKNAWPDKNSHRDGNDTDPDSVTVKNLVLRVDPVCVIGLQQMARLVFEINAKNKAVPQTPYQYLRGKIFYIDPATPRVWADLLCEDDEIAVKTYFPAERITGETLCFDKVNVRKTIDPQQGIQLSITDTRLAGEIPGTPEFKRQVHAAMEAFRNYRMN